VFIEGTRLSYLNVYSRCIHS